MVQMAASYKYIFYFCNVKSHKRYDAAAKSSVFCAKNLLFNIAVWSGVTAMSPRSLSLCEPDSSNGIFFCLNSHKL